MITLYRATHTDEMCNFYLMYYTDVDHGDAFGMCGINQYPYLLRELPPGNDVPLPPNPLLESKAAGHMEQGNGGGDERSRSQQYRDLPSSDGHRMAAPPGGHMFPMMMMRGTRRMLTGIDGGGWYRNDFHPEPKPDYDNPYEYNSNDNARDEDPNYFYYDVANQRSRDRHRGYQPVDTTAYSGQGRGQIGDGENVGRGASSRGSHGNNGRNHGDSIARGPASRIGTGRKKLPPGGARVHTPRTNTPLHTNPPSASAASPRQPEVGQKVVPAPTSSCK